MVLTVPFGGTIGTMSKTTIEAWRCDKCQWVWISDTKPERCSRCKSRTWDVQVLEAGMASSEDMELARKTKVPYIECADVRKVSKGEVVKAIVDTLLRKSHDKANCRVYGCLMCKAGEK